LEPKENMMLKYRLQRVLDSDAQDIYVGPDVVGTIYREGDFWRGISYEPDAVLPPRWTQSEAAGDVMKLWEAVRRAEWCQTHHDSGDNLGGKELPLFKNVTALDVVVILAITLFLIVCIIGMVVAGR